jgi:hypothetical protein
MVAGERPGDPEVEKAFSLEEVFGWYRDCPEQIERKVIIGDAACAGRGTRYSNEAARGIHGSDSGS